MSARTAELARKKQEEKRRRERFWFVVTEYVIPSAMVALLGTFLCYWFFTSWIYM